MPLNKYIIILFCTALARLFILMLNKTGCMSKVNVFAHTDKSSLPSIKYWAKPCRSLVTCPVRWFPAVYVTDWSDNILPYSISLCRSCVSFPIASTCSCLSGLRR